MGDADVQFVREKHHRRSIRLRGYDYTQPGAYFVTICTRGRECLFGEIVDAKMHSNEVGRMVQSTWEEIPRHYAGAGIDGFVVMPNHFHGIIVLRDHPVVGATPRGCPVSRQAQGPAPTMLLSDVVKRFKSLTTARFRHAATKSAWPGFCGRLWQRNYYEHIVRDDDEWNRIRRYIGDNPLMWELDRENPRGHTATISESWQV